MNPANRWKICLDCHQQVQGNNRCPECRAAQEKQRGTKKDRGYGAQFEAEKRKPAYLQATHCATCSEPFTNDNPKTAGHVEAIRRGGGNQIKPECRRCNMGWRKTGS